MDENDVAILIMVGIGAILILFALSIPVTGTIAGYTIKLPFIAWIGFAAFAVIALYLFFKHRA